MTKKQNIEIYNEEVREIMKEIPGSLLRWGATVIFLIFASIIIGSYFFTFKEIVSAPLIITTTNPPAPLISKASGRIERWFVSDGTMVNRDDNVALIENTASLKDIFRLQDILNELDSSETSGILAFELPENLLLGELQELYNQFYRNWEGYKNYLKENFLPQKIELLQQQTIKQEEQYQLSLKEKQMIEQELAIAKIGFGRYESMLGKGGISESQLEEERARLIQSERGYTSFLSSLKSAEINLINQKRSLLDLQEQYRNEIAKFESDITDEISILKNQLKNWKDKYLLISPIKGKVTLTKYWSENHVISSGERIATIVPPDSTMIICRAVVPSSGISKINIGQKVNIKLIGYPYMEYGTLTGKIQSISLVPGENGYVAEIRLKEGMLSSYSEQLKLVQEMDGTAEIITKEMRMIYRFINPLKAVLNN
jgi:multidrug efflux pump subunit AcrA (membrane-fusion protein)